MSTRTEAATPVTKLEHGAEVSLYASVGRVLCVIVPLIVWFVPFDMDPTAKKALAIGSFMLLSWITEAMDHALTGLIGCYLFWAFRVVEFNVAFSGFGPTRSSPPTRTRRPRSPTAPASPSAGWRRAAG